ncbi:hypothetical protein Tco_0047457 [Tanacetum coccineum]
MALNPSPGKEIDVYFMPLIDDLKVFMGQSQCRDLVVSTGLKFNMGDGSIGPSIDFLRSMTRQGNGQDLKASGVFEVDLGIGKTKRGSARSSLSSKVDDIICNLESLILLPIFGHYDQLVIPFTLEAIVRRAYSPPEDESILFDDEDLVNLDIDDGVNVVYSSENEDLSVVCYRCQLMCTGSRLGDGGGKGTRKPNLGRRRAGRLHTRQETRNLRLKAITDKSGLVPIRFKVNDRETLVPLGDHAAHWANYLGELVRELLLHYPSWRQMPPEQKAGVVENIGTQFDLRPHMESDRWPQIYAGIQQHLQKIYNGKKAALKERYWVPEEDGTYDLERLRRGRPSHISEVNCVAQLVSLWTIN